ncbi:Predicted neuraminidase (sialidase) [Chlamydia poikilotherma]|uniref:Predicted neuraminidase (Sialidase) n=1 Tax=Chlamydia poikilotherma TaxID=1967783 RepID=A0A3B0Q0P2_9CHLA|nr:sialidase family protein [Chlamydia poikilotherma]SYX09135.1 Predicted neuraminidase (sialidase) [Chlamydia poikilotherma]
MWKSWIFLLIFSPLSLCFGEYKPYKELWLSSENSISSSSTIVETSGKLLVVWQESNKLIGRYCDRGVWSEPSEIFPQESANFSKPVLVRISSQEIWLFYRKQLFGENVSRPYIAFSFNAGKNWSEHRLLPPGLEGTTRNPPYVDRIRNQIYIPSYSIYGMLTDQELVGASWVEIYNFCSRSWEGRFGPILGRTRNQVPIEPAIVSLASNKLALFCRNASVEENYICMSISTTRGTSWSKLKNLPWRSYNSSIAVQSGRSGRLFLFANSAPNGEGLTCFPSYNEGLTWNHPKLIDADYSVDPCAYLDKQGYMHIVYTGKDISGNQRIKYYGIEEEALLLNCPEYWITNSLEESIRE